VSEVIVRDQRPDIPESVEEDFPDVVPLIRQCWMRNPGDRPSADEVVDALEAIVKQRSEQL
jgi:hypothetical protein